MSVAKGKRTLSEVAFYDNAYKLHMELTKYLLNDFGIKKSSYDYNIFMNRAKIAKDDKEKLMELFEKYGIEVESDYARYVVYHYRDAIINLLDSMIENISRAYTIFPNTEEDWNMKRRYQNQAIGDINVIKTKLLIASKALPVNFERYTPFVKQIDEEITKLKQWRGDCNKQRNKCMENDASKRAKAESKVAKKIIEDNLKQRESTVAEEVIKISKMNFDASYQFPRYIMNQSYLNYMTGNYTLNFNENGRIIDSTNPIPGLLSLDQYGNSIAPVY